MLKPNSVLLSALLAWALPGTAALPPLGELVSNAGGRNADLAAVGQLRTGVTCTAALVRFSSAAGAPAYVLSNGHCAGTSGANDVLLDRAATGTVTFHFFFDTPEEARQRVPVKRVAYATQKGADIAILELDATLDGLAARGVRPLELAARVPAEGETIRIAGVPLAGSKQEFLRLSSCAQGPVRRILESVWQSFDVFRNDCVGVRGGSSGSPLLDRDGRVFATLFTTTAGSPSYADCFRDRPCEVGADSVQSIENANYASPIANLERCFDGSGRFDVQGAGCPLDPGNQFRLSGYPPRATQPAVAGQRVTWNTTLSSDTLTHYRYKFGPVGGTDCRDTSGYGPVYSLATRPRIEDLIPEAEGRYQLCVIGGRTAEFDAAWQQPRFATSVRLEVDVTPPKVKPPLQLDPGEDSYMASLIFAPPELSSFRYKFGPAADTRCEDPGGYRQQLTFFRIPMRDEPTRFCGRGSDVAGNEGPPLDVVLQRTGVYNAAANALTGRIAPGEYVQFQAAELKSEVAVEVVDSAAARPARLLSAGDRAVAFVVPEDALPGEGVVRVTMASGSILLRCRIERIAPGLFTADSSGSGAPAGLLVVPGQPPRPLFDCSPDLAQCKPAPIQLPRDGDAWVELFGSGIRGRTSLDAVQARIGGEAATVTYAGPHSQYYGLDQVNLRLPPALAGRGEADLLLTVENVECNPVRLLFR